MKTKLLQLSLAACAVLGISGSAKAAHQGLFGGYNLGVSYAATTSYASISYNAPNVAKAPPDCQQSSQDPSVMNCKASLGPDSSSGASNVSVFLERPFERQGLFYFEPGFTFSTITYKGGLVTTPKSALSSSKSTPKEASKPDPTNPGNVDGQPLNAAYMSMYGINWQGFLRFGLTPRYLPDLLCTLGLGLQTVGGQLRIFKESKNRYVVQPEAFGEVELVLIRAGTGALSLFVGTDQTLVSQLNSHLIEDHPSGTNLTNFQLSLVAGSAGVRLLFPF